MEVDSQVTNEVLEKNLDRIIGFVANCDSKVSYLFSAVGIILTILFAVKPMNLILIRSALNSNVPDVMLGFAILGLIISLSYFLAGIYSLSQALIAQTQSHSENSDSKIFFGAIASQGNSQNYLSNVNNDGYSYREDLACQIYINSKICTEKFEKYNRGLKFIRRSLLLLIICWSYLF